MSKAPKSSDYIDDLCKETNKNNRKRGNRELTVLLNRFNKKELLKSVIETPYDKTQNVARKKENLIKDAINLLTEKFSDLDELILFLHLRYYLTERRNRIWHAFEIKDGKRFKRSGLSSIEVSESVLKYCYKNNIPCKLYSEKRGDCMWFVAFLDEDKPQKPTCFIVHLKISHVFYHSLKQKYKATILQVFRKAYRGKDIKEVSNFSADIEYIQKLNIKAIQSLLQNSNEKKSVKATVVDLQNSFVEDVKEENKDVTNLQKNTASQHIKGKTSDCIEDNLETCDKTKTKESKESNFAADKTNINKRPEDLQDNLSSHNVRTRSEALKNVQNISVSHTSEELAPENVKNNFVINEAKSKEKTSNDLHHKLVVRNVIEKTDDNMQGNLKSQKIKKKPSNDFQNHIKYLSVIEEDSCDDFEKNIGTKKKKKPSNNFQNNIMTSDAKKKKKLKDLRGNVVNKDIKEKSNTSNILQNTFVISNKKKKKISDNSQSNILTKKMSLKYKASETLVRNIRKKKKPSTDFQNIVTSNPKKKPKDLQNNTVVHEAKAKENISNVLNSTFVVTNGRRNETSGDFEKGIVTKDANLKNNTSQRNFTSHNVNEENPHDFQTDPVHVSRKRPGNYFEGSGHFRKREKNAQKPAENCTVPAVEELKYIMKANFFGSRDNANSVCLVNFKGTNVLKGLEKLVESGIINAPLPKYLYEEPKTGRTEFIVTL